MSWDPFREMAPLAISQQKLEFFPDFDVKETKDQYVFKADMPGVKSNDLEVSVFREQPHHRRQARVRARGEDDTYYAMERSYGSFQRSFTLPEGANVDAVEADLKDGVLTLTIGKKPQAQAKKIPVGTTATKS